MIEFIEQNLPNGVSDATRPSGYARCLLNYQGQWYFDTISSGVFQNKTLMLLPPRDVTKQELIELAKAHLLKYEAK